MVDHLEAEYICAVEQNLSEWFISSMPLPVLYTLFVLTKLRRKQCVYFPYVVDWILTWTVVRHEAVMAWLRVIGDPDVAAAAEEEGVGGEGVGWQVEESYAMAHMQLSEAVSDREMDGRPRVYERGTNWVPLHLVCARL